MELILKYFPDLTEHQARQFAAMEGLYREWNDRINLISRKDLDNFYERHVLHSLAIARAIRFKEGTRVLDAGTGGGFPGIPLAVFFPGSTFHLVDSTKKKLDAVAAVAGELGLSNVTTRHVRLEELEGKYDFIVSRAVTGLLTFYKWTWKNLAKRSSNELPNGILYLKGNDLETEFIGSFRNHKIWELSEFFDEEFFETKRLVYFG